MIYLWIVSFIWAFSFGLIKGSLTNLDPIFVAFCRLAISMLVFLPFFDLKTVRRSTALLLFGIGAVQFGVMYIAYIYAFQYLQSYEVALFTILTPLYVSIYSQSRTGRLALLPVLTALLAVAGAAIIVYTRQLEPGFLVGFLIVQVSNLAFAIGQVEYRRAMQPAIGVGDHRVMAWLYLGGVAATGAASLLWSDISKVHIEPSQWLTLLYLGAVASGLGFFLFNSGARRVDSAMLAIFNNVKIPLSVAVSILVFREEASVILLAGGTLLMAAALWLQARMVSTPAGTTGTG